MADTTDNITPDNSANRPSGKSESDASTAEPGPLAQASIKGDAANASSMVDGDIPINIQDPSSHDDSANDEDQAQDIIDDRPAQAHQPANLATDQAYQDAKSSPDNSNRLEALAQTTIPLSCRIGQVIMSLDQLRSLTPGVVLDLNSPGPPYVEIFSGSIAVAKAECIQTDNDAVALRVTEILMGKG